MEMSDAADPPRLQSSPSIASMTDDAAIADEEIKVALITDRIKTKKSICLFYVKEAANIARAIVKKNNHICLGTIEWGRFDCENGWPNLFIKNANKLHLYHCIFIASFHEPSVMFEQLSAIYAISRYGCKSLKLVLPFFPTGTMERVTKVGEVATASCLARMVSSVPMTATGPTQLVIFDIHALQEQFYFTDNVIIHLKSCIPLFKQKIKEYIKADEKVVISFPDDGAYKRFNIYFEEFPTIVCQKQRIGNKRIVNVRDGSEFCENAHIIIVDDLTKSGGTLIECAKCLKLLGAAEVSCYVTHACFTNDSEKKFMSEIQASKDLKFHVKYFFITDTVPTMSDRLQGVKPFEVLSIAELF